MGTIFFREHSFGCSYNWVLLLYCILLSSLLVVGGFFNSKYLYSYLERTRNLIEIYFFVFIHTWGVMQCQRYLYSDVNIGICIQIWTAVNVRWSWDTVLLWVRMGCFKQHFIKMSTDILKRFSFKNNGEHIYFIQTKMHNNVLWEHWIYK